MISTGDPLAKESSQEPADDKAARSSTPKEGTPSFLSDSPAQKPDPSDHHDEANALPSKPTKRKRLPQDVVGKFEDRLVDSPADVGAWKGLIGEYKKQEKLDELRSTYERMLKYFPASAETWCEYIETELDNGEFSKVDKLFGRCLKKVPNLNLWKLYLGYIRRRHDTKSGDENAVNTVSSAFEFVLNEVGIDKDSGQLWSQYIDFVKSKPATSTWEEQQKMDLLRKTYQRAICIPLSNLELLWQNYNQFEQKMNKTTARKFIAERSAKYMSARSAVKEMAQMIDHIDRFNTTPSPRKWNTKEKNRMVQWFKWINWEKQNPLEAGVSVVKTRVWYAYQQATMSMRYYPELWFDAAEYGLENDLSDNGEGDGREMLVKGCDANPCSFLLHLKKAEMEENVKEFDAMTKTFDSLIENLQKARATLSEDALEDNARDITAAFAAKMRCTNRSLGVKPARAIFSQCRKLSYFTNEIFVSAAKMECYNNKEQSIAAKIFELGLKKFGEEPNYVKEYFDFLIQNNDDVNARALFEKSVSKMSPENAKSLYQHFMNYEANFGELSALLRLEKRYKEMYPKQVDNVELFATRNTIAKHDPIHELDFGSRFGAATSANGTDEPAAKRARSGSPPEEPESPPTLPQSIISLLEVLPSTDLYDTARFDSAKLMQTVKEVDLSGL